MNVQNEGVLMHRTLIPLFTASWLALGCGGSYPVPTQQLADTESAERSAGELGANSDPAAQLHLQLAQEQLALAKTAIRDGDNDRAHALLLRAKSDAELAIALTRAHSAKTEASKATEQSNTQRATNAQQPGGQ
jgi:Domain of unknown function (DUF4398)